MPVLVYAHRGASGVRPENTRPAFLEAIAQGADGIETDVQMSRDGRLVLCHDEKLNRTTNGRGPLAARTWDELKALDAGAWFGREYAGTRLPLLEELLELFAPTALVLNIELKNGIVPYPGLEQAVVERVRRYGLVERVLISSFNHASLAVVKRYAPEIKTAILYSRRLTDPCLSARQVGADLLHPYFRRVRAEVVARAHAAGLTVNAWTVNRKRRIDAMLRAGVDGLITNYPDRVLARLAEHCQTIADPRE